MNSVVKVFCVRNFKRQIIHAVKQANVLLLAKKEEVLQAMIESLIEIGRRCGMEMNVEKQK
jgi:hypothetical protein